ncbi:putative cell survival pathways protein, partial [Ascosphaera acerosa]
QERMWYSRLLSRSNDPRPLWLVAVSPFLLLTYPATVWAAVVYGVSIMWLSYTTTTQSEIFAVPPYNMSVAAVGLTNFASLLGGLAGMLWGGQVADWWTLRCTRRNSGIMEPEFRLWTLVVPALVNTAGLLLYGFGALHGLHWIGPAGFGQALISFGIGSSGAIAITYAVDCYPLLASESLVLILFGRNLIGTGFTFAIQPWLDHSGLQDTTIVMAVICFVFNMSFLTFSWKGKDLRRWTARRYLQAALRKEHAGLQPSLLTRALAPPPPQHPADTAPPGATSFASVAGTQEPVYGKEALHSVTEQTKETPWTELKKEDMRWAALETTNVECQTFYLNSDNGDCCFLQVLYSNLAGLHITCSFNAKVFKRNGTNHWNQDTIYDYMFDEELYSFGGENLAVELNEDGTAYSIKSAVNESTIINVVVTRLTPAFCVGKNGTTYYGTDVNNPWGTMRHAFWPRCKCVGTITTPEREIDFTGQAFYVHALQGMKPHHAARKWNFANFQGPTFSACLMEFTTPPSYDNQTIAAGGIARDGEIVCAGTDITTTHLTTEKDSVNEWPEPTSVSVVWRGKTKDGKDVRAEIAGDIGKRLDRIDIMAEIPGFVKNVIGTVAGTKPYVYQYIPEPKLALKVKIGDEEFEETGTLFCEASFIS